MIRKCHRHLSSLLTFCLPSIRNQLLPQVLTMHARNYSEKSIRTTKRPDWNRAILEAEQVVGHPNLFLSLQPLPGDDVLSFAGQIRKLVGTAHPLLKIIKRLIYNERNNMQIRGLIILLTAKLNENSSGRSTNDQCISTNQQSLAKVTEMIHMARIIHKEVVNLSGLELDDGSQIKDMEVGNKITILVGDYFLANATLQMGKLINTEAAGMMSLAIRNFVEGEFIFDQDQCGNGYPSPSTTVHDWEVQTYLCSGSLLANGCRSAALLAARDESIQNRAFEFGKQLGWTWQSFADLKLFMDDQKSRMPFELTSSPVILHLIKDPSILDMILPHRENLSNVDYKKIYSILRKGPALQEAEQLCRKYTQDTIEILHQFPDSDARQALENIIYAME